MARTKPPSFEAEQIFAELESASDRTVILVGGALLEYALERVIEARLRIPENPKEARILFNDHSGILGTFREKIWGAYFLKAIGPAVRSDLDCIRRIRNFAAHCRNFQVAAEPLKKGADPTTMKMRFLATVQFFTANLLMRAGDTDAEIAEAFKGRAPSLDR